MTINNKTREFIKKKKLIKIEKLESESKKIWSLFFKNNKFFDVIDNNKKRVYFA